ncbi:MAG: LacI family DNA-binding transcriptional regulator [Clostridia bacterium]|nr:LacI family DNA-binding transcriptional regulator [Clostridia bacterium]
MHKRATITDVAEKAGFSVATVSRFFADNGYPVSSDASKKIEKAARELDYTPNIVGRMLKTNSSRDIGVIIPTIRNPFYPDVLLGIEKSAASRGYQILLCNSMRDRETEIKYINSLYQKQVRGIILASAQNNLSYENLAGKGMHIVNLESDDSCGFCSGIDFDYRLGGRLLAGHLKDMNHERIAFITSPLTKKSRQDILEGIRSIYKDRVLTVIDNRETEDETGIYEYQMGMRMAGDILKSGKSITGIIAVNDMTGAGVIKGIMDLGLDVPGDISVAGFDNIDLSSMISPSLTTIDQPGFETGKLAANMIIDLIEGNEIKYDRLEPRLIIRASTGKAGGKYD